MLVHNHLAQGLRLAQGFFIYIVERMLLITRKESEGIVINDAIEITVVEVKAGRVKLGFTFPEGNTIYRKELFLKIQEENLAAAHGVGRLDKLIAAMTNPQLKSKLAVPNPDDEKSGTTIANKNTEKTGAKSKKGD